MIFDHVFTTEISVKQLNLNLSPSW